MKKFALLIVLTQFNAFAQTIITNVTIADVEKQKLIGNRTVIINDGVITDVVSGSVKAPTTASIIDGTGKYLLPGLVDAHVHFFQNGGLYARPDAIDLREIQPYDKEIADSKRLMESQLKRYLRNGITTVIDPGGPNNMLKLKTVIDGKSSAPSVFMSGPLLTTFEPEVYHGLKDDAPFILTLTPEDARKAVQEQVKRKSDFIKIWYIANVEDLSREAGARKYLPVVKAAIDEAHKNNLKVAVHATERLTAQLAVENGCDFLVHSIEDEVLSDDFVKLIKKKNVIVCPTLVVHAGYIDTFGQQLKISSHELRESDPFQLGSLLDLKHIQIKDTTLVKNYFGYATSEKQRAKMLSEQQICFKNLKKLSDAGVIIATGTDAGNIGTLHAASYLDELLAMKAAGLSNWKIIEASTISGAKVLGHENRFGSITKGKLANLILLDANPVENIENLTKINRVINKGVVFEPGKVIAETPAELVQRQLNAYNFRNIDAFLDTYADDVEIYTYPDKLNYTGKTKMRERYARLFAEVPNLHCEILGRIVQGNVVIDKERVQFDKEIVEATAIYHIENGKIKKVYFIK